MNIDIKLPAVISEANSIIGLLNIFKEVEQGSCFVDNAEAKITLVYKTAGHIQFINLEFVG